MPSTADLLKAALADRYRIDREIGQGGMATVYLAEDLKHRRKVAVKVLRPELAATLGPRPVLPGDRSRRPTAASAHPAAARLRRGRRLPLLRDAVRRGRVAPGAARPARASSRSTRRCDSSAKWRTRWPRPTRRGVVHRDIKPDNVMLSGRHALVTDFGVAKAVSEATGRKQLTTAGVALGTPAYMAPEQAAADPASRSAGGHLRVRGAGLRAAHRKHSIRRKDRLRKCSRRT